MLKIDRRIFRDIDWLLFWSVVIIPLCSLVVLFSAGYDPESTLGDSSFLPDWFKSLTAFRQGIFLFVGIILMFVVAAIPPSFFRRFAYLFYGGTVLLLVLVLVAGTVVNGSRRWIAMGAINLQPAEPMKIALILAMARYLSARVPPAGGYRFVQVIIPALLFGVPMALILVQPDLGTALAVGGTGGMMLLFMGVRFRLLLVLAIAGLVSMPLGWSKLHDYQKKRVLTLIDPEADPLGSGYHIIQSKIAVGSGGLTGKGYLKGTQTQLEFLPEHTTDFAFSVLSEEWGFVGSATIILLLVHLLYRLLRTAQKCNNLFHTLVVFGVASKLFFHAAVNVGMVIGILPVVGIPLPLFSYGGSSLLSNLIALGMVLGIAARRRAFVS